MIIKVNKSQLFTFKLKAKITISEKLTLAIPSHFLCTKLNNNNKMSGTDAVIVYALSPGQANDNPIG